MNQQARQRINELGSQRLPFLFVLDFEQQAPLVMPLSEVPAHSLLYRIGPYSHAEAPVSFPEKEIIFTKQPVDFQEYNKKFELVLSELRAGNSYLCNLTARTPVSCNAGLHELFGCTVARYQLWLRPGAFHTGFFQEEILCFSPEIFVRIDENGRLSTYPMKGTQDAALPDARHRLLNNQKEYSEHATIVDLLRNDIAAVATGRRVERFRYVEELATNQKTLLQVSSEISGQLPAGWHTRLGDVLARLLPAGSVTGAPKVSTLGIIRRAEAEPRGYYTGIMGVFDGQRLDSGVMIRFLERTSDGLFFRSGGGLTSRSEARSEYQELIDKVYLPLR